MPPSAVGVIPGQPAAQVVPDSGAGAVLDTSQDSVVDPPISVTRGIAKIAWYSV
jgi:hypothetical protein